MTDKRTGLEIAIIGMSGRFPGAVNIKAFRDNLEKGIESVAFLSRRELAELGEAPGEMAKPDYVKACGGLLENDVYFDAFFFDYTPTEALLMDPQARIFHECAWEALEDAAYVPSAYDDYIGLYAGGAPGLGWGYRAFSSDTARELGDWQTLHLAYKDFLPTRVSHRLDLRGPALLIQTACSTALAAVHMASRALLTGDCRLALAGGVSILPDQQRGYVYQEGMIFSPDGHCRAFDARSNGTASGSGVGIVVLKMLQAAVRDDDHLYAVIKGSAINNDGIRKMGYTTPGVTGQAEVIRAALRFARVEPESITYIETHGTGTALGDQIEIQALKKAFNTEQKGFCALGAVKTNVGHLGPAAGAAGLIKTILALQQRQIFPTLHFEVPHPELQLENSPFYVNTVLKEWKAGKFPLRAGVSSFGIGGTNVHVILEEAPALDDNDSRQHPVRGGVSPPSPSSDYQLIILSAKTPTALDKMTENLAGYLRKNLLNHGNPGNPINPGQNPGTHLAEAAYTLQVGRESYASRQMLVCQEVEEAIHILTTPGTRKLRRFHSQKENVPVIFMFSGLGAQYVNMGRHLYENQPVFQQEIERCGEILKPLWDNNIKEILYPDDSRGKEKEPLLLHDIQVAQAAVFILEYALARLLMEWGIKPRAMIGYSFGEYGAACISGVLSLEAALKLVVTRGKLVNKLAVGAMLSVPLQREKLEPLLAGTHHTLSIAIDNGPTCLVAGPVQTVAAFEQEMKKHRLMCMPVPMARALHTPMMEPIVKEFENSVRQNTLHPPRIPYISNVTGTWITPAEAVEPAYWAGHLRETVQFARGVKELLKIENAIFVEIGPGQDLTSITGRFINNGLGQRVFNIIPPYRENLPGGDYLLNRLGNLWGRGVKIDWQKLHTGKKKQRISLPTYPFEGRPYCFDTLPGRDSRERDQTAGSIGMPMKENDKNASGMNRVNRRPGNEKRVEILQPRPALTSEYIPPANQIQQKLVQIWEKFFGVQPVGIEDDFIEIGGDSLKAAVLVTRIKEQLALEIPITEFFNRPTINALSSLAVREPGKFPSSFNNTGQTREKDNQLGGPGKNFQEELRQYIEKDVVLLNPDISVAKKLYCFPSGIGHGIVYKNLASMISGYSFYALTFIEDIEDARRIKKYVDIITRMQSPGPYRLLGYSVGWKLAFEVTRALENNGYEVSDIILLDSFWPEPAISAGTGGTGDTNSPLTQMVGKYLQDLGMETLKNSAVEKMRKYKVYWSAPYRPEKVKANIHLILAGPLRVTDRDGCWRPFTTGGYWEYQGEGEHAAMLTAAYLEKNAGILREILDKIR